MGNDGSKTLIDFLDDIGDMHGEPHDVRMIRESTGTGTRECQVDDIESPSHMGERLIHENCALHCGCKAVVDDRGSCGKVENHDLDRDRGEDSPLFPVCSHGHLFCVWKKCHKRMKIRPPSEDICGDCLMMANTSRDDKRRENNTTRDHEDDIVCGDDADNAWFSQPLKVVAGMEMRNEDEMSVDQVECTDAEPDEVRGGGATIHGTQS